MKLSFTLSRAKDKETLVMCYIGFAGQYRRLSTKMIVDVKDWDKKRQRLKFNSTEAHALNNFFDSVYTKAVTFEAKLKLEGQEYTIDTLTDFLKKVFTPVKETAHNNKILSYFAYIIEQKKADPNFSKGSVVVYNTTYKHLSEYIEKDINLLELDLHFWKNFANHLYGLNFKPNHVNKIVTTTRTVVRLASDQGIEVNKTVFMSNLLTKIGCTKQTDITKVYLNYTELKKIEELTLNERLNNVRNLFLIGCYTGLRFSDVVALTPNNFDGNYIKIVTKKTREKVAIPIHPVVKKICADGLPYRITNQRTNDYLKEIMQLACIDNNIIVTEYKGGKNKRTDTVKMKWELIGTHTARRTFATNMYLAGDVPVHSIMKITGHRSEKSFLQYIVLENKEHTEIVGMSKFFKE